MKLATMQPYNRAVDKFHDYFGSANLAAISRSSGKVATGESSCYTCHATAL